jgi:hypothetical protein
MKWDFFVDLYMTTGWVKLHRKLLESSLFQNHNAFIVFSACLMLASHEKKKFPFNGDDVDISPGEFVTGIHKLSEYCHISAQQARTALAYLKVTNRITIKTTNKFSLVKVNKWDDYQESNKQNNKQITNQQQTNNYNQELKELKNNTTVTKVTGVIELNNEIHPMSELEPTYEREDKPKRKSKHGNKTMAVLAYAYAKASGADLTKTINGSAWLKPLSEIYDYFDKDVDAAVKYITDSVNYYESITMRDGSKCKYSVRTIQNVADVLRLMDETPKINKSDIFF